MRKIKTSDQIERHTKGISNHYRIDILFVIDQHKIISLDKISKILDANPKTIGEHTRRLYRAGLINKNYNGRFVEHSLSPYGKFFVKFLKDFQKM